MNILDREHIVVSSALLVPILHFAMTMLILPLQRHMHIKIRRNPVFTLNKVAMVYNFLVLLLMFLSKKDYVLGPEDPKAKLGTSLRSTNWGGSKFSAPSTCINNPWRG
jgi:hypothetical protein